MRIILSLQLLIIFDMNTEKRIHQELKDDGYNLQARLIICDWVFGRPHLYPAVWNEARHERFKDAHDSVIERMQKLATDETLADPDTTSFDQV